MLDLADVDKQLEALGRSPDDLAGLVAQHIGAKFSLAEVDRALAGLVQGVTFQQASIAPNRVPSLQPVAERFSEQPREPSIRATLVEHPSLTVPLPTVEPNDAADDYRDPQDAEPAVDQSADLDAETAALLASDSERPTGLTPVPAGGDMDDEPQLSLSGESERPDPAFASGSGSASGSVRPDPVGPSQPPKRSSVPASLPPLQRLRSAISSLLAQDLDPNDFPRTPPSGIASPPVAAAGADEDEFEMLLDDDELLEVDDDEPPKTDP